MDSPLPTDYHGRRAMTQSQVGNDKSQVASCYCLFAPFTPKVPNEDVSEESQFTNQKGALM